MWEGSLLENPTGATPARPRADAVRERGRVRDAQGAADGAGQERDGVAHPAAGGRREGPGAPGAASRAATWAGRGSTPHAGEGAGEEGGRRGERGTRGGGRPAALREGGSRGRQHRLQTRPALPCPAPRALHLAQVQEWKLKCEAIEKRENERREAEAKKHKEEVQYLENYAKQLKQQLEAFLVPTAKAPKPQGS